MKRALFLPFLLSLLLTLPHQLLAQSPAARQAFDAANDLYYSGNYDAALKSYEQILKDFPTDILVPFVTVQTGFANFFLGNFDKSIQILEKAATEPTTPKDLLPSIASFLPQVYASKAASLPADDPKRKDAFLQAIQKYTDYIQQYPNEPQVESARYGRALCKFQIQDLPGVVSDLEENLKQFPNSPTIADSQNLLAIALASLAGEELNRGDSADRQKASSLLARAKDLLRDIINKKSNLVLVNDARFQLAEILFAEATFAPDDHKPALYQQAMEAYRSVVPASEMIALQEEILARFPERRKRVLTNKLALAALDREIEREQRRLGELKAKPDIVATARMKLGEIYFNKGDLNRARVVLRHIMPFLTKDDDKLRAQYFLTLTYILQNKVDEAVKNYELFQSQFKGAPIAQNLPLAMGNLFLSHPDPNIRNPQKAIQYFDESLQIYPQGSMAGLTVVTKATALLSLGQIQEAEQTFLKFLEGKPTRQEALIAQSGLGNIFVQTKQWDKAIETYKKIAAEYPETPQATEAQYWIAICTQQKGDNQNAIPLLKEFAQKHPDSPLLPNVLYSIASAQLALQDRAAAIQTLSEIAEKFPDSPPAPVTYFMRAQLLAQEGKLEDANALIRQFMEKYPKSERIFGAYDWLAQQAYRAAQWEQAIKFYEDFVQIYPQDPNAPIALLRVAEYSKQWAESLGRYAALPTDEQAIWQERMKRSLEAASKFVDTYPESELLPTAIQALVAAHEALVNAEIQPQSQMEIAIKTKAAATQNPAVRSKILFGLASFLAKHDPPRALQTMDEAFDKSIQYLPADLDTYATALLDANRVNDAKAVYEKMAADYPVPAGTDPTNAPPLVQHAQANALFGLGRIAQLEGNSAAAAEKFEQLKKLYPWSPKILEAELGIAQAQVESGKFEEPLARLPAIIRAPNANTDVRAKAMLLGGLAMEKKMAAATDEKARNDALGAAIDYYIKIDQFYSGVPNTAAEGLWRGAQLLEKQAAAASDPEFKKRQLNNARRAYQDLIKKYPASPFVQQAQERLNALGQ